jgi:hypothetical protein
MEHVSGESISQMRGGTWNKFRWFYPHQSFGAPRLWTLASRLLIYVEKNTRLWSLVSTLGRRSPRPSGWSWQKILPFFEEVALVWGLRHRRGTQSLPSPSRHDGGWRIASSGWARCARRSEIGGSRVFSTLRGRNMFHVPLRGRGSTPSTVSVRGSSGR